MVLRMFSECSYGQRRRWSKRHSILCSTLLDAFGRCEVYESAYEVVEGREELMMPEIAPDDVISRKCEVSHRVQHRPLLDPALSPVLHDETEPDVSPVTHSEVQSKAHSAIHSRSSMSERRAVRTVRKVRYTDAEWATIVARARECGKVPARYVRDVSLGAIPKAKRSHANAELVREIGRIGNALTSTLTELRSVVHGGVASPDSEAISGIGETLSEALSEILAAVRRID